jgi:hypothetical protein
VISRHNKHFIPHMMQAITSVVDIVSLNNNTNFKSYKILQPNMKHLLNLAKYYYLYFHAIKRSIQLINFPIQKLLYYHHAGAKGERSYSSYSFLTSALHGGEWSVPHPSYALPRERTPGTDWIGGWVGHTAGLDTEPKGKILFLRRGSNPSHPVCSQTLYLLSS